LQRDNVRCRQTDGLDTNLIGQIQQAVLLAAELPDFPATRRQKARALL
jgi:hypothetical protein